MWINYHRKGGEVEMKMITEQMLKILVGEGVFKRIQEKYSQIIDQEVDVMENKYSLSKDSVNFLLEYLTEHGLD